MTSRLNKCIRRIDPFTLKYLIQFSTILAVGVMATACGSSTPVPSAPTSSAVSVSAVAVTSAATSGASFQLTAIARMSDGSSRDVTSTATWESSNVQVATVTSAGQVTVVGDGDVDLRATYQGVSGVAHVTVSLPRTFMFSGAVAEVAPTVRPVAGARVQIVVGKYTLSDTNGIFAISGLPAGRTIIEVTKDGYQTFTTDLVFDHDLQLEIHLYPTPPTNSNGTTATGRCNDGSWTWAQTRADACTLNGGVAYAVCPGPFCAP